MTNINLENKTIDYISELNVEYIIDLLVRQLSYEEIEEVIKRIDEGVGDWGFTENLYKHFAELHEEYIAEENS